jgi:hypothetical protein
MNDRVLPKAFPRSTVWQRRICHPTCRDTSEREYRIIGPCKLIEDADGPRLDQFGAAAELLSLPSALGSSDVRAPPVSVPETERSNRGSNATPRAAFSPAVES